MTVTEAFEARAASAGAALRSAFLVEQPAPAARAPVRRREVWRQRWQVPAAALAAAATVVAAFVLTPQRTQTDDVLGSGADRELAVLAPPYLFGSGTLPDAEVSSVERFPVPFTFRAPALPGGGESWWYQTGRAFEVGFGRNAAQVLAPTETYDPGRTWQGQRQLVPAPTDAAGWSQWLEDSDHVEVTSRKYLVIGGAPATRFEVELDDLPDAYDGCGGGRRCLAVHPFDDPGVGPGQAGTGPQAGLDDSVAELTVIELGDRAVLVLVGGNPDAREEWLPTLRRLVDSLRFA